MTIEMWEIGRVKPYEANPRENEGAVQARAKSIASPTNSVERLC